MSPEELQYTSVVVAQTVLQSKCEVAKVLTRQLQAEQ